MRICKRCATEQPEDQFYAGQSNGWCKSCRAKDNRERAKAGKDKRSPEAHRNNFLKRTYNIDSTVFNAIMAEQQGVCAACKEPPPEGKYLCVDHDHSCCPRTGSCGACIRGLLCNGCNAALGHVKDSRQKLLDLIDYLDGLA